MKRFAPEIAPTSEESCGGFKSKNVIIDPLKEITGRIFLSDHIPEPCTLLPVLIYFHGGGFCIGSTTWLGYHHFLGDFSVVSQSIILSIDYHLAPKNRLPTAYDDCYSSLEWLCNQDTNEPWLKQADLSRVFLSGGRASGNIVHQVAIKAVRNGTLCVKIRGILLIHPFFGSEKRTEKEKADAAAGYVAMSDMFWRLSISDWSNSDYYGCNFEKQDVSDALWREFRAVAIYVAGLDFLKERGVMYDEFLQRKEVKMVKLVETKNESRVVHVFRLKSEATRSLQLQMSKFMKNN